ncbi:flagellar export protein FliJ [Neptunomonas antarctica]|uniref:Flagellar FliJ protein n=1 Tax=Neptunomonas antarctica TaxID=619304 RepID=A0A1N7JCG2_9GAMM|nr:flagellar export protein FliJ [Neptunomonas antarctica]SIS46951.1 flagellar FliJ protein [Neptunomonas antarctica]
MSIKKRSGRLKVVLDLAEKRKKEAERFLAEQIQRVENDKQQLVQLELYLAEYQQGYRQDSAQGLSIDRMLNYQGFMNKISVAIEQHKKSMLMNEKQLAQVKQYWAQMHGKYKAIDSLVVKALDDEVKAVDKVLQKELDERSQLSRITYL